MLQVLDEQTAMINHIRQIPCTNRTEQAVHDL